MIIFLYKAKLTHLKVVVLLRLRRWSSFELSSRWVRGRSPSWIIAVESSHKNYFFSRLVFFYSYWFSKTKNLPWKIPRSDLIRFRLLWLVRLSNEHLDIEKFKIKNFLTFKLSGFEISNDLTFIIKYFLDFLLTFLQNKDN